VTEGAARILVALRGAGEARLSGEALSAQLGVSRAQIWKHVGTLRAAGYQIEGEPGGGYRLAAAPDRLYAEEVQPRLSTRWLARRFEWLDSTDSTNRVAADLAREGAEHGTTVVAEGQSAGRGRLGRAFFSPPYANLYTSIVLRPNLDTAAHRPRSWRRRSRSPTQSPPSRATRMPSRSSGRTTCCSAASRPPGS
jgi:BirA family biotin operon repressor/biotin-[acetyl-CoA-carboxylase] ligase